MQESEKLFNSVVKAISKDKETLKDTALIYDDTSQKKCVSYGKLIQLMKGCVAELQNYQINHDEYIGIDASDVNIEVLIALLSLFRCNTIVCPLDLTGDFEQSVKLCKILNIKHIILCKTTIKNNGKVEEWMSNDSSTTHELSSLIGSLLLIRLSLSNSSLGKTDLMTNNESIEFVVQSSGSTGSPKIIQVPGKCIYPNILDLCSKFNITTKDAIFLSSPLTFDASIVQIFIALLSGAALVMTSASIKRQPSKLCDVLFERNKTTIFQATPSLAKQIGQHLSNNGRSFSDTSLRIICLGAEPFPSKKLMKNLIGDTSQIEVYNIYGISEVSSWASMGRVNISSTEDTEAVVNLDSMLVDGDKEAIDRFCCQNVPIGNPLSGTVIEVRSDDGRKIHDGFGQIWIGGGERVCLVGDETELTPGKMRFSGDIGLIMNSQIYYIERSDNRVKIFGRFVDLEIIESLVQEIPGIESAVCVVTNTNLDNSQSYLTLFVSHHEDLQEYGKIESEISLKLRSSLPPHCVPSKISFIPRIPITPHGKKDRRAMQRFATSISKKPRANNSELLENRLFCSENHGSRKGRSFFPLNSDHLIDGRVDSTEDENCLEALFANENPNGNRKDRLLLAADKTILQETLPHNLEISSEYHSKKIFSVPDSLDVLKKGLLEIFENALQNGCYKSIDCVNNKSFIENGGDSVLAVFVEKEVRDRLRKTFGSEAEIPELFDYILSRDFGKLVQYLELEINKGRVIDHLLTIEENFEGHIDKCKHSSLHNGRQEINDHHSLNKTDISDDLGNINNRCSSLLHKRKRENSDQTNNSENIPCSQVKKQSIGTDNSCFHSVSKGSKIWKYDNISSADLPLKRQNEKRESNFTNLKFIIKWTYNTLKCVDASPLVVSNVHHDSSTVYIGSHSHYFVAIDMKTGGIVWKTKLGDRIESSAALSKYGDKIIVGCYDHHVYVINRKDGGILWKFRTGDCVKSSPIQHPDSGLVFVGSHDQNIYALDVNSFEEVWRRHCGGGSCFCSPALDLDKDAVFIGTLAGNMVSLNADTGSINWVYSSNKPIFSSPLALKTLVCFGCVDGCLYAVSVNDGRLMWKVETGGPIFSSPSLCCGERPVFQELGQMVGTTGTVGLCEDDQNATLNSKTNSKSFDLSSLVLFGSHDSHLYCVSTNGHLRWKFKTNSPVYSTATFYEDENYQNIADNSSHASRQFVVCCSTKGRVNIVDVESGESISSIDLPGEVFSSLVVHGNRIVVGCRDDNVYCLEIL